MKQLKCTQCGATINSDTLTCEYCGSVFFSSELAEEAAKKRKAKELEADKDQSKNEFIDSYKSDNIRVRNLTDEELYNVIKTLTTNHPAQFIFPIVFMLVWTSIAFSIFMSTFDLHLLINGRLSILFMVPLIFVVIGATTIVRLVAQALSKNIHFELNLIKQGEYNGAMLSLEKKETRKHNVKYVAALIMLDYFRLNNFDGARQHIIKLPQAELSELIKRSSIVLEVARELGVRTPDFVESVVNSIKARFESFYNNK